LFLDSASGKTSLIRLSSSALSVTGADSNSKTISVVGCQQILKPQLPLQAGGKPAGVLDDGLVQNDENSVKAVART